MSLSLLSVALLATSALAAPRPEVEVVQVRELVKRQDPTSVDLADLIPTGLDLSALESLIPTGSVDLSSLLGDISTALPSGLMGCLPPDNLLAVPTPPANVASAIMTYTDYCHEPSFTGSLGAEWSSYVSAVSKYSDEHGEEISSWISALSTDCPYASLIPTNAGQVSELIGSYTIPSCTGSSQGPKETGATTPKASTGSEKPTGTAAETKSDASGTAGAPAQNTGAAPKQTALAAVAGAIAGFAGFVAVL